MEFTPSWGVERVWGNYNYYNTGSPAADKYAFVIDSGISKNTNDLNVNTEFAKSFVPNQQDPFDDGLGHGTAVASVIGAIADDHGLTGVAPGAQVVPLKVFSNSGFTTNWRVQRACRYAMEVILENDLVDKAVVNLSLGGNKPDNHDIIKEMNDAGITVVISAGNSATDVDGVSPASYGHLPNVYTISSTTRDGYYSNFTNFDSGNDEDDVDFSAPGSFVPTYRTDGTVKSSNGTSFSAPHVAGLFLMGGVKAGPLQKLTNKQRQNGMIADPLALLADPAPVLDERIRFRGDSLDNIIEGGNNRDRLRGAAGNDSIYGFEGDDIIRGGKGDDYLDAGTGSDIIGAGKGNDIIADQRDGDVDFIFIRPNSGVKTIVGLDDNDKIGIKGTYPWNISVSAVDDGVGIYAFNKLAAVYTNNNLSVAEIEDIVFHI